MSEFFERWYGDRCPVWTWPATIGAFAIVGITIVFLHGMARQWACEAKGGTVSKPDGCYLVTSKKID